MAEHKDGILRFLEEDANARFTFEQAGAVEEYLQRFRPEKENRKLVERLFSEGRLEIIGSQIQPEVFLGGVKHSSGTCRQAKRPVQGSE